MEMQTYAEFRDFLSSYGVDFQIPQEEGQPKEFRADHVYGDWAIALTELSPDTVALVPRALGRQIVTHIPREHRDKIRYVVRSPFNLDDPREYRSDSDARVFWWKYDPQ